MKWSKQQEATYIGLALARACLPWGRGVWVPHQEGMRACSWLQKMNYLNLKIRAKIIHVTNAKIAKQWLFTEWFFPQTSANKHIFLRLLPFPLSAWLNANQPIGNIYPYWHSWPSYLLVIWGAALPFWAQWVCPTSGTLGYKWESWPTVCQWDCSFCHVFSFQFGCVVPWRDMTLTHLK